MMPINRLFTKVPSWLTHHLPESFTGKDVARVLAINSFAVIIVAVCLVYAIIFKFQQDILLFGVCLSIAVLCLVPLILNYLRFYDLSRLLYAMQAPIFVLFFASVFGPAFGIQYFFVLLFWFPFLYFKRQERKRIIMFFVYNVACMSYFEFGGPVGIEEATFTPEMYRAIKITIIALFILMTSIFFFTFQQEMISDEQKMMKTKFEKENAVQVKQELIGAMSHELRTPLNDVVTITNILEENPNHPQRLEFLKLLKQTSNNMLSITNDIMDFNELEANKLKLVNKSQDLCKIVEDVVDTYRGIAEVKGLKVSVEMDNELAKYYKVDQAKIGQILGNLLNNAISFTDEGQVTIGVYKKKAEGVFDEVVFEVTDTGKGISPEELEHIFEGYLQIKSLIRQKPGAGLGLAIAKRLLKIYKSNIVVESAPGVGSKFSFTLRLKTSRKLQNPKNKKLLVLQDKKILLVEDNLVNAMVAEKLLESWGLIVTKKENGQEAIASFGQDSFDFVLMDLHMPIMDGYEAVKRIREGDFEHHDIPVYALTADVMGEENQAFYHYFDGFFTKPIQKEKLQSVLIDTLSKKRKRTKVV